MAIEAGDVCMNVHSAAVMSHSNGRSRTEEVGDIVARSTSEMVEGVGDVPLSLPHMSSLKGEPACRSEHGEDGELVT
jgi:hypothetical protein